MGIDFAYFAAATDEEAAGTVGRAKGPGSQDVLVEPAAAPRRGLFGRRREAVPEYVVDPALPVYDTLRVRGIDPMVQLATLEEVLTARRYEQIINDPRHAHCLAEHDEGAQIVVTLTDSLHDALVRIDDLRLESLAERWFQTEEFRQGWVFAEVVEFLADLVALARRARESGHRLYCWVSL